MIKYIFPFLFLGSFLAKGQINVNTIADLPEKVSNNAVSEGFNNGKTYLYSFGGIDSTKLYSGIHLKSWRYNVDDDVVEILPNLPDTLGKIAMGASRIGDIIYIVGGYHVYSNGSELSSDKVHRFHIPSNNFLTDAEPIPVATDDHIQGVWNDSLLYVITGWSDVGNIDDVQIYDPVSNSWHAGTDIPHPTYRSFGGSGTIVGDTIYYFGGARSTGNFSIQNDLRKGVINPQNPLEINWTISKPNPNIAGYRMACTSVNGEVHWIGGSNDTYNYNGIAYNGSGGVSPNNRDLFLALQDDQTFQETSHSFDIPMDLRGVAKENENTQYLIGGMENNQSVSSKIIKLTWQTDPVSIVEVENSDVNALVVQNKILEFTAKNNGHIHVVNTLGQIIWSQTYKKGENQLSLNHLSGGIYFITLENGGIGYKVLVK